MIIPSIDLKDGSTVQLVGGEQLALDAGEPVAIAERFRVAGELAVIDLDAALGTGNNEELVKRVLAVADVRIGGGIRDLATATRWLDAGASKIILGTAASPELLGQLPRERVMAALDTRHGEVVVEGWTKGTGQDVFSRMEALRPYVGGFLVTLVEREGRMGGVDLELVERLRDAAGDVRLTLAGGVTTAEEVGALDALGVDAQVGMALYTGRMDLGDAVAAPLRSDRVDGLWPTVVADEHGVTLGLVYSDAESVRAAVQKTQGIYHSRRRGLWVKGESSGDVQTLLRITPDCDRDALRFTVRQEGGGFCHLGTRGCFGEDGGLPWLARLTRERRDHAPEGSYTRRLFEEQGLLDAKLLEEARELTEARSPEDVCHEAADVLYFTLVRMAAAGVELSDVEAELRRRHRAVSRRPGDRKPEDG